MNNEAPCKQGVDIGSVALHQVVNNSHQPDCSNDEQPSCSNHEEFKLVTRQSRKNPYTRTLKNITSMMHWYNNTHKPHDDKYKECEFNKFVMKLTHRDIDKITQLMNFIKEDTYYDSIDKITSFNQQEYLHRKNIKPDEK